MKISFVLIKPAIPENTGPPARAIKTIAYKNLSHANPLVISTAEPDGSHTILMNQLPPTRRHSSASLFWE